MGRLLARAALVAACLSAQRSKGVKSGQKGSSLAFCLMRCFSSASARQTGIAPRLNFLLFRRAGAKDHARGQALPIKKM